MKTGTYNSWWREMGAISRGMMFIEGSITTPSTLQPTQRDARATPDSQRSPAPGAAPAQQQGKAFSWYEELLFLGGRPMTAGRNDDLDEPFLQTYDEPLQERSRHGRLHEQHNTGCVTC